MDPYRAYRAYRAIEQEYLANLIPPDTRARDDAACIAFGVAIGAALTWASRLLWAWFGW